MSTESNWWWESDSTCIGNSCVPDVLLVEVTSIPNTEDPVSIIFQKIDDIYTISEEGFGVIFDISKLDMQLRHWKVLLQTGKFFQNMGTPKQSKASRGIAIIVGSSVTQALVNRATAMFPSPVEVKCHCSMKDAVCMFDSSTERLATVTSQVG